MLKTAMNTAIKTEINAYDWNIKTNVGPVLLSIFIDSAFFRHPEQQNTQRHRHATFEFHSITKGTGRIITDNAGYEVTPDCFYIVRAGIYHMQEGSISDPVVRNSFKFEFDIGNKALIEYSQAEIRKFVYILSNIQFYFSRNLASIKNILNEIQTELENKHFGYYTKVQQLFSILFISIMRDIAGQSDFSPNTELREILPESRISIIDRFFETNHNYKATALDLCRLVHISKSQLNRIMKDKYNMTYKQKHMETQIEHIKYLLVNTDLSIREISDKFGYTSEGNFTAFVKRLTGRSPKAFRKHGREAAHIDEAESLHETFI